jgi:hypothetical protein
MDDELERAGEEVVMNSFKVMFQYSLGGPARINS